MRRSNLFVTSSKETESDLDCKSAELSVKAGLVKNFGSGTWSYSHLGKKVLDNIEDVVREEMDKIAQEVMMHQLQTSDIWKKSGRWKNFEGEEFFNFENRDGKEFTIAATHEEAAVELGRQYIRSYRDLDLTIYQIGRKFRDDHARKGLLRAKEFVMKDAYSFHRNREGLNRNYQEFLQAYRNVYDRLGLEYSEVQAETGSMGGSKSHEFIAEAEVGSDSYMKCKSDSCRFGTKEMDTEKCQRCGSDLRRVDGIEIGHCFKLDDRYSKEESMNLKFDTEDGEKEKVVMGCYGIGISRLISAIIEQNHDEAGITWNQEVSAFNAAVIAARHEDEAEQKAEEIYRELKDQGVEILLYDDEQSVGEQFAEADLLGINTKIIIGENYLEDGEIDVELRNGLTKKASSEKEVKEMI